MERKTIAIICILGVVLNCTTQKSEKPRVNPGKIQFNRTPPVGTFPREPVKLPGKLARFVQEAENFDDLFRTITFIKLEDREESFIKTVNDVAVVGEYIFVMDFFQKKIIQFKRDGAFVRLLGRQGQGPGEYFQPFCIRSCYDGNVAVCDGLKILVYDTDGGYLRTSNIERLFHLSSGFIWNTERRLFLSDIPESQENAPWHAIVNYDENDFGSILFGFEKRFPPLVESDSRPGFKEMSFTAFNLIGDTIWTGSPYECQIKVFDLEGRFLTKLNPNYPGGAQSRDFDNFNYEKGDSRSILRKKRTYQSIHQVGPLVVCLTQSGSSTLVDIYNANGKMLRRGLKVGRLLPRLFCSSQGELVGDYWDTISDMSFDDFAKNMPLSVAQKLRLTGPINNDSTYLWIKGIKGSLK